MWQLVLLLPILVLVLSLWLNAWHAYVIYRDVDQRTAHDISGERRPIPAGLVEVCQQLSQLGFERLGEEEQDLPSVGLLAVLTSRRQRHTAWLFTDRGATTQASVTTHMLELSSRLGDGSYVETLATTGSQIDEPDLYVSFSRGDAASAYRQHLASVAARAASHGTPSPVADMAEQGARGADFRARFAKRQLRRPLVTGWLVPLGLIAAVLVVLGVVTYVLSTMIENL